MIDIPVVAFFSVEINQSHYSAASTYGKFAFICTQFLLYFKLPEIRQASSFLQILKYALRIALLSLIPIVILSITPSNIQSLLFTEQYEAVPYIALLQSFALFPYLVSMALVQLLITRHAVRSVVLLLGLCLIFPISFLIFQPSSMGTVLLQLSLGIVLLLFLSLEVRKLLKLKIRKDSVVGEVVFVVGTTAEMIKIAPVVQGIHSAQIWNLSQQKFDVLSYIPAYFGKHNFVVRTREGDALQAGFKSFTWLFESVRFLIAQIMSNRSSGPSGRNSLLIVVHGDTLTAGLTAITSKILGLKVAHIEAGLRSHNLRHPFPEELIRILISRFADIHFCPTAEDLANIRKRNTRKILTNGNTFLNSFIPIAQKVLSEGKMSGQNLFRNRPFVLIHLHRLEFIKRNKLVVDTFAEISKLNTRFDLVLVLDPHLESVLQKLQLLESVHSCMNVLGKQSRENFTRLVWNAEFVITDSGGTQEELGYLGIPALIHRVATERSDGLGENISLSKWNISSIDKFSKEYKRFKKPCTSTVCDPTGVILSILRKSDVNDS
jgi:UDP-N-acetylglucosamine 2-epimerase (non-hydrolysing)